MRPILLTCSASERVCTCAGEIADHDPGGTWRQLRECRHALLRARMQDDLVAFADQGLGSTATESIGGTRDEDATHGAFLSRRHARQDQRRYRQRQPRPTQFVAADRAVILMSARP